MTNIIAFGPVREANVKKVFDARSRKRAVVARLTLAALVLVVAVAAFDLLLRLLALPYPGPPVALQSGAFDPTAEVALFSLQAEPTTTCKNVKPGPGSVGAFIPADDRTSRSALLSRCATVDELFVEGLAFGVDLGTVIPLASDGWIAEMAALGRPVQLVLAARFLGPDGTSRPLLETPDARARLIRDLETAWPSGTGLCLDLSGNPGVAPHQVRDLLFALRLLADARKASLCVIGGLDAGFLTDRGVIQTVDRIVAKGFKEPGRLPLPLAPQLWFDAAVTRLNSTVPQEKLVLALGTFGLQIDAATGHVEQVAYATAMARVRAAAGSASVDPVTLNTEMVFDDSDGRVVQVMLLDGLSFANQFAQALPGARIAVWPLGYEDPAVWPLIAGIEPQDVLSGPVSLESRVLLSGTGPVALQVEAAANGLRAVEVDPHTGRLTSQHYKVWPAPHLLRRIDGGVPDAVLIAFDGLPPPDHLSEVLGHLARHGTRAVFAASASEILSGRDTIRRLVATGHAIALTDIGDLEGNSLFANVSRLRDRTAAMALAGETGWRSVLAETWGPGEILPGTVNEFATLIALQNQGRIRLPLGEPVPEHPEDAADFAERVVSTVFLEGSQLVRFSLSPRSLDSTLETLPVVLSEFEKAGARFIAPDDLARPAGGVAMFEARELTTLRDRIYIWMLLKADAVLASVFFVLLIVALVRSLAFLTLAHLRHPRRTIDPEWSPPVTVVVPAFNEGKVIETCIRSIFDNGYPDTRVVVVDDGSTDDTTKLVEAIAARNPRVRIVRQENAGKWAAANTALRYVETPFFIILDADSMLEKDAIRWLVQPFVDEDVGAVSGLVEVGNAHNWLTSCQDLEYRVSQNIHRRAYETFDGILVVPGAIGAWRTATVIAAGLFSGETITEDADLTLAVHRAGFRVVMAENARALTEAPETLRPFLSQRLRWTLGMLQVSWKHRGTIREGRTVGYISILDAIWFSVLTTILSPLVDVIMIFVLGLIASRAMLGQSVMGDGTIVFLAGYLGLMLIDLMNTLATFRFERRFSMKLLLLTPLLRLGYRQLLYVSTLRAVWRAITGRLSNWNKLERTGAMNNRVHGGSTAAIDLTMRT